MRIYIPSYQRAGQPLTTERLPSGMDVWLVTVPEEEKAYRKRWHNVLACPHRGIGRTRQWIIDQHDTEALGNGLLMLDDDLRFASRRADDPTKFLQATENEIRYALWDIRERLESYAHVALATREGGNRNTEEYLEDTRTLRALAYDVTVLRRHDIRFDRVRYMEDFDVSLQLLEHGYGNLVVNYLVQDQRGSGAAGGCSAEGRSIAAQSAAAVALWELHPDVVKVVRKQTKHAWGGQTRYDVQIQWKKAKAK